VFRRLFRNVVRGFVGLRQKSQIFVGAFSLVQHDPKGSHYKVSNQGRGILREIIKKSVTVAGFAPAYKVTISYNNREYAVRNLQVK